MLPPPAQKPPRNDYTVCRSKFAWIVKQICIFQRESISLTKTTRSVHFAGMCNSSKQCTLYLMTDCWMYFWCGPARAVQGFGRVQHPCRISSSIRTLMKSNGFEKQHFVTMSGVPCPPPKTLRTHQTHVWPGTGNWYMALFQMEQINVASGTRIIF